MKKIKIEKIKSNNIGNASKLNITKVRKNKNVDKIIFFILC